MHGVRRRAAVRVLGERLAADGASSEPAIADVMFARTYSKAVRCVLQVQLARISHASTGPSTHAQVCRAVTKNDMRSSTSRRHRLNITSRMGTTRGDSGGQHEQMHGRHVRPK